MQLSVKTLLLFVAQPFRLRLVEQIAPFLQLVDYGRH